MRSLAAFLFFLNPILWASYFAVTREALDRYEPAVFATLDMMAALPFGLAILALTWKRLNREALFAGFVLGCFHASETLLEMYALDHTTATNTGVVANLQGVVAIFIAVVILGRRIGPPTWFAALLSLAGVAILMLESAEAGGHWYGDVLAILAMVLFTIHIFAIDHFTADTKLSIVCCLGVEQVVAALVTGAGSTVLADWSAFAMPGQSDMLIIFYIAVFTGLLPSAIALFFQPYVSPVFVVFVYLIEPLWVALIAFLYIGETLTPIGYMGGGLVILGALINTLFDKSEGSREAAPAGAGA